MVLWYNLLDYNHKKFGDECFTMQSDVSIAQQASLLPINKIAENLNICEDDLIPYGKYKAKISLSVMEKLKSKPNGKLILVTAINPTPAGEGKTTVTVGLGQGMAKIGKNAIIALREPSLGPVFGIKGGAAGGGYSQAVPMEDINLHFTGDMHAITAANNLLCALIDNHIQQGNELSIDVRQILFSRVLDMNDRALRNVTIGLGGKFNGVPREDHFTITVASEVMAILCLSNDLEDLKRRLGSILIAYTMDNKPVYAKDIGAEGAMTVLLKDAINPNLVQTLENTPAIIHGGPFANIAHGCNSIIATKMALKLADYCITEAGFGSDLGAEKFLDIACPSGNMSPSAVILVATIRSLKYNGGVDKNNLYEENLDQLQDGLCNLQAHIENMKKYGLPVIVALNHFISDTDEEIKLVEDFCKSQNVPYSLSKGFTDGGEGTRDLALKVTNACEQPNSYSPIYKEDSSIEEKIYTIATEIYGADDVVYSDAAKNAIKRINSLNLQGLRVCIAKTQYSLSDNPALLGRPKGFKLNVNNIKLSAGAGFVVAISGGIMTMPGLPKKPAALSIDCDEDGVITGLF